MIKKVFFLIFLLLPVLYSIMRLQQNFILYSSIGITYFLLSLDYIWTKKIKTSFFLQLGITFIFLDLTFQKITWNTFLSFFNDIHWTYLIPIILSVWLNLFTRSFKWRFLLPKKNISLYSLFSATSIGFMINAIFPARLGEIARGIILSDETKLTYSTTITTVFVERILDGFVLSLFVLVLFFGFPLQKAQFARYIISGAVLFFIALLVLIALYFFRNLVETIISFVVIRFSKKLNQKIMKFLDKIYNGLHIFKKRKNLFVFVGLTIVNWTINLFTIILIMKSVQAHALFGFTNINYFYSSLLVLILICMAIALPSGPGGAGPYQYIVLFAFMILNPQIRQSPLLRSKAAGFSIYIWAIQSLAIIILGLFFYIKDKHSFKQLKEIQQQKT